MDGVTLMISLFRNIDIFFLHQVISSFRFGSEISRFPTQNRKKNEIIERGLEPHSIDSFRQSMAEESISDYTFSHSPILSGQKLDRKFFVSLNFSWAALHLLRDSQRPPTKHRVHQCASCFNDWSYFPPYPMFWPLFCPFWIGNYQFCKNKRNHMLVWIKAWEPNSQPENQCVVQVLQAKALQAGSGLV